jgi:RND superfamily putative drug exporter
VVAVAAVPFFALRLGVADAGTDPAGSTTRQAYDMLARGFGPDSESLNLDLARLDLACRGADAEPW